MVSINHVGASIVMAKTVNIKHVGASWVLQELDSWSQIMTRWWVNKGQLTIDTDDNDDARNYVCRLQKNKTYRIRRSAKSTRMRIATYGENIFREIPTANIRLTWNSYVDNSDSDDLEFEVSMGDAQYLVVYYTNAGEDVEITVEEVV